MSHDHGSSGTRRRQTSAREVFERGIWKENPVFVQLLGLCPTLAVTGTVSNAIAMSTATAFVLVGSSIFVSALRKAIPHAVRISTYVLIVATFVTIADLYMRAVVPEVSKALGPFVYLIVVNCIILGRHEAFVSKNPIGRSLLDTTGVSIGFFLALVLMGAVRELLGAGTLLGVHVLPKTFEPWVIMALPPGGFFTIAFILLGLNAWSRRHAARDRAVRGVMNPVVRQERVA